MLGGAANTAAKSFLGGRATLITLAGADEAAELKGRAADAGVDFVAITHGSPTLRKTRVVSQQSRWCASDYEDVQSASAAITEAEILRALTPTSRQRHRRDFRLRQGLCLPAVARTVIERRTRLAGRSSLTPGRSIAIHIGCDYITPNWKEARAC